MAIGTEPGARRCSGFEWRREWDSGGPEEFSRIGHGRPAGVIRRGIDFASLRLFSLASGSLVVELRSNPFSQYQQGPAPLRWGWPLLMAERVGLSHSLRSRDLSFPLSRDSESTCGSNPFSQYQQGPAPLRWGWPLLMAERVGFEPTVGCPTLDFESSALNQTQPSLRFTLRRLRLQIECEALYAVWLRFQQPLSRQRHSAISPKRPEGGTELSTLNVQLSTFK